MAKASGPKRRQRRSNDEEVRERILEAAFMAFKENGYAASSTLEIATRARVSKRELYALVGNKQEMLVACISRRAKRLEMPADLPTPRDRDGLERVLAGCGTQLLREVSEPPVVAMFRLAVAEAIHAPEVARTLDAIGRETSRATVGKIMAGALASGLLNGDPAKLVEQYGGLLFGELLVGMMLGVTARPAPDEMAQRAREAAAAFLRIHPLP
jgi:AcrR family transcriptional regulator